MSSTIFQGIEYRAADGLVTIELNRPPANVLDIVTMLELDRAVAQVAEDASARVLLLTAPGEKTFSAGVDLADHTPDKVDRMIEVFHGLVRRLLTFPLPTIAALNGSALGGGCEVALACDMIVAHEQVKLGQPEIKLGVFPTMAAILLPRLVPRSAALELLLGGGLATGADAKAMGLVNRLFPRETFHADARAFAAQFASLSRAALVQSKRAIAAAEDQSFAAALPVVERIYLRDLMTTADAVEGLKSFIEKRKPTWTHR